MTTIDLPSVPAAVRTTCDATTSRPATDRTDGPQPPALDRRTLENLGDELSNPASAMEFAQLFLQMLPQRIDAVEAAFAARATDAAVVALLSLKASASMVGARRLAEESSTALEVVGEPSGYESAIARLRSLATDFQSALGGIIR